MTVVIEIGGEKIWMRDRNSLEGITSAAYLKDGTQLKIIAALEDALVQAKGQAGLSNDIN